MILVTGAAGFIGSCLVTTLTHARHDVVICDAFSREQKLANFEGKQVYAAVERMALDDWLRDHGQSLTAVYHLGARTDTAEMDTTIFDKLNLEYSKMVWQHCVEYQIPLCYASSAATYGDGNLGYSDLHEIIPSLRPLNPYGQSKQDFDLWVMKQEDTPPQWYGVKFFNVYGPNEYHKGRMASVIFHAYHLIKTQGYMNLFRSHRPDIKDGEQSRDFVSVFDVIAMSQHLIDQHCYSGIYNVGTGTARTFYDLTLATFAAMGVEADIRFIDTPIDIRDKYQYYTQADMGKMLNSGYQHPMKSLEEGVLEYVQDYLSSSRRY